MLQNEYLVAIVAVHTAENEPFKFFNYKKYRSLESSLAAVSTPIFATKASFFSIFRELHDLHTFAPLQSQNFQNFAQHFGENFEIFKSSFAKFCWYVLKSVIFRREFHGFLPEFRRISAVLMKLTLQCSEFQNSLRKS